MTKSRNLGDNLNQKLQRNVNALFPEQETIPTHLSIQQVMALKARVSELEETLARQQLETQTLLAQVDEYRSQAKQARNFQIREDWEKFLQKQEKLTAGYAFSHNEVKSVLLSEAVPFENYKTQVLSKGDDRIGTIMIQGANLKETDEILKVVAEQLSSHIENLRLMEQNKKRAYDLETVSNVSVATTTLLDPHVLLQSVVDLTKTRFGLYHAHIYLIDEVGEYLLLTVGAGEVGKRMVAEGWNIPMRHPTSIVARVAREKKFVIVNDVYRNKNSSFLSNQLLPDTRSEMAVPMVIGDKLLGVFDVQANTPDYFSDDDAHIFITLASQIAVALQNARLYMEQAATVTQLRELDRLKSAFLANMSHELRTPLNSILGFTDVMLEGLDGELTDYMDNDLRLIQKNGQHLLHLINDVLDMAKIESGHMNLHPEKFKVQDIFYDVNSLTSSLASAKNNQLIVEEDSDQEVELFADHTRIKQVMINLVNNAIKFTTNGRISMRAAKMDDARVLITVKDTGLGIPANHLESIFQEFSQVDTSTTRKAGGTGLGLPISRRLIEMHGGQLWAESTGIEGKGSTFFIELPIEARITEVVEKQEKS